MPTTKRVAYAFAAEEPGELTVQEGDTVFVSDDPAASRDGWTVVENTSGESGFVPTDYLEAAPDLADTKETHAAPSGLESLESLATPAAVGAGGAAGGSSSMYGAGRAYGGGTAAAPTTPSAFALAQIGDNASASSTFGDPGALSADNISRALSNDDFSALFASHEEWFKQATSKRAETFGGLQTAVADLTKSMANCESRNHAIVEQISELDAIIDEERLKWQARLEKERTLLEKEKRVLAAAERMDVRGGATGGGDVGSAASNGGGTGAAGGGAVAVGRDA